MSTWPHDNGNAIERHVRQLRPRSSDTVKVYRCVLRGFQRFVQQLRCGAVINEATLRAWLHERAACWPQHLVRHRARIVDRFLDFLESERLIPRNPLAELRTLYGQRTGTPIVRALLATDSARALDALRSPPRFASFLGGMMREHVELMRTARHRYEAQAGRLLRFDRFLQGRSDLAVQPLRVLQQQWEAQSPTLSHCLGVREGGARSRSSLATS